MLLLLSGAFGVGLSAASAAAQEVGRVTGRVVDRATGQPLPSAQVQVAGTAVGAAADLDGRFRTAPVPAGVYSLRVRRIGFQQTQVDSVRVSGGTATVVNVALTAAPVSLQAVVIQEQATPAASSGAGLLALQQRAAAASDGISAEQISRTPDANAGDAASRVSGVSIVDDKFVVVRGLAERYSNTLLNGVEIASPEPTKKIVPLDIFPASLLEAIVVSKSATPDRPGDFSGGSVEIRTKEFPENFVLQFNLSQGYNSRTTFRSSPLPARRGLDYLGFDGRNRNVPPGGTSDDPEATERFAESIRNQWAPRGVRAQPNLGLGFNVGGQSSLLGNPLGAVLSFTYSANNELNPNRLSQFVADPASDPQRGFVYQDNRAVVDWGSILNFSWRLGQSTKLGWKNLYTRNAEESYLTTAGFNVDRNGDIRSYQFRYIERDLLQTQLAGEHLIAPLLSSRVEWKATYGAARRDEPDNRQVTYVRPPSVSEYSLGQNSDLWFRFLDDRQYAGQLDWSVPLNLRRERDGSVKVGGAYRDKRRDFDARFYSFNIDQGANPPVGFDQLPPELIFTPENIGSYIKITRPGQRAQPYSADDDLTAGYAMVDVPLLARLRFVGGLRVEAWRLDLRDGERVMPDTTGGVPPAAPDTANGGAPSATPITRRRDTDPLWSGNLTFAITDRMNLRLAGFRSVARPDTRELSRDSYVSEPGTCPERGNPTLRRSIVINADARWEWYPRPGEVLSLSAFYKDFDAPILQVVTAENNCTFTYENGVSARNSGVELEVRRSLDFLPGALRRLSAGANVTYVRSRVTIDSAFGRYDPDLALQDQSPYLVNANLAYGDPARRLTASLLYNSFADRISRYGFRLGDVTQGPNIIERGRSALDAKLQKGFGARYTLTLAGRNLTNAAVTFVQETASGTVDTGYIKPGVSFSVAVGYAY